MAGLLNQGAGMMDNQAPSMGPSQGMGGPEAAMIALIRSKFNALPPEKKAEIGALASPEVARALNDLGLTQLAQFLQSYASRAAQPAPASPEPQGLMDD